MNIWQKVSSLFGNPSGIGGALAGFIMTYRTSNRERNIWAVDLLDLQLSDHVLEIGFGPGLALEMMSKCIASGIIYGIDHSRMMVEFAQKRNQAFMSSGRMKLFLGSVSNLPQEIQGIDKVLDVNSFQFWENPLDSLCCIRDCMNTGGKIAIVHQPRNPGATERDADEEGKRISSFLEKAGFQMISVHKKQMRPVALVCVMGNA